MIILGIETSCDETAAAIIKGENNNITVLSDIISSQIKIHQPYGGVVPELAAREHAVKVLPVIDEALTRAGIKKSTAPKKIGAIAVAAGPGLITSLLAGVETAKVLSHVWNIPLVSVNHIEGHIYANFIAQYPKLPALILTVSGGHTLLALMKSEDSIKTLGETRDDAAGEAFDKAAKLMGLGYPGGPIISKYAEKIKKTDIKLPRPMIDSPDFDFSFSGLKTAIRYELEKDGQWQKRIEEYCFEFQQAIIDVLIHKTIKAAKKYNINSIMLSGGVSANKELRRQLEQAVKQIPNSNFYVPDAKHTTDNAVMMAVSGYYKARADKFTPWQKLTVNSNLELYVLLFLMLSMAG